MPRLWGYWINDVDKNGKAKVDVMQSTLSDEEPPEVYRLKDNSPIRFETLCVYHNRNVELKAFNEYRNIPSSYRSSDGRCTTTPRYVIVYPDGTRFALCWKHVPTELREHNMKGTYTGGEYGDSQ